MLSEIIGSAIGSVATLVAAFGVLLFANRQKFLEQRVKAETRQKIKMDSILEISKSLPGLEFAISQANYKISNTGQEIITKISTAVVENAAREVPQKEMLLDAIRKIIRVQRVSLRIGENSIIEELKQIKRFISLLKNDLAIGKEKEIIKKLEAIYEEINEAANFFIGGEKYTVFQDKIRNILQNRTSINEVNVIIGKINNLCNEALEN